MAAQENVCEPLSAALGPAPGAVTQAGSSGRGDTVTRSRGGTAELEQLPAAAAALGSRQLFPRWISEQGPFITHYSCIYLGLVLKCCCF